MILTRTRKSLWYWAHCSLLILLVTLVVGCSGGHLVAEKGNEPAATARDVTASHDIEYCGRKLADGSVREYIHRLAAYIKTGSPKHLDKSLFARHVLLVSDGASTRVNRNELVTYSGHLPSIDDWREILVSLRHGDLHSAGWRGCYLNAGKAWFQSARDGSLGLSAFDFGRTWNGAGKDSHTEVIN